MTDYARVRASFDYSDKSDYSRPMLKDTYLVELTPDEVLHRRIDIATTPGTVVDASEFTTVTGVFLKNLDSAIAIQVDWTSKTAATASAISLPAGEWCFFSDFNPASTFTLMAASGAPRLEIYIVGT